MSLLSPETPRLLWVSLGVSEANSLFLMRSGWSKRRRRKQGLHTLATFVSISNISPVYPPHCQWALIVIDGVLLSRWAHVVRRWVPVVNFESNTIVLLFPPAGSYPSSSQCQAWILFGVKFNSRHRTTLQQSNRNITCPIRPLLWPTACITSHKPVSSTPTYQHLT